MLDRFINVLAEFQSHSLYIGNIIKFKEKNTKISYNSNIPENKLEEIKIRDLSFSYPSMSNKILNNINLNIKKGETIGIVGRNGAGKTTLIKLILNLYEPTNGEILLGNKNIQQFNPESYRYGFGIIFQDFNLYALSLRENVIMEGINNNASHKDISNIDKKIINSFKYIDFNKFFEDKNINLDISISNEIDDNGKLFSGGEAQKIALSRIVYSDRNYIILDEPSSALDPISEYNFNKKIIEFSKNKTVFIISHRLSTTSLCDRILFIENGQIVEQGTHKELMELNGKYKYMYNIQAQKYLEDLGAQGDSPLVLLSPPATSMSLTHSVYFS